MQKKKRNRGKGKGSGFEREVAKLIAKAFAPFGIKQQECWRSVLSGGHSMSCGDLVLSARLEAMFPYAVECKWWKEIDWIHFLVSPSKREKHWKETKWVKQAQDSVEKRPELIPLLVMKENRGKIWAFHPLHVDSSLPGVHGWRFELFSSLLKRKVREAENEK